MVFSQTSVAQGVIANLGGRRLLENASREMAPAKFWKPVKPWEILDPRRFATTPNRVNSKAHLYDFGKHRDILLFAPSAFTRAARDGRAR